jgi:hypothetical protein
MDVACFISFFLPCRAMTPDSVRDFTNRPLPTNAVGNFHGTSGFGVQTNFIPCSRPAPPRRLFGNAPDFSTLEHETALTNLRRLNHRDIVLYIQFIVATFKCSTCERQQKWLGNFRRRMNFCRMKCDKSFDHYDARERVQLAHGNI